ncbi:MAG: 2-oxoacid:acceptor oxidoreductase family protein [Promethearchaeota archaeon]
MTGVGGQGVVLIGNLLREYGLRNPLIKNVVGTETRGVSQREGSVLATVRYLIDNRVYSLDQDYQVEDLISPLIPINDAHIFLGLEPLETIRNLKYISEQTVVIFNTNIYYPRNVIIGKEKNMKYPSIAYILDILDQFARKTISMNFNELSIEKFNNSIYSNIIILGVGAKEFKEFFKKKIIIQILEEFFSDPAKNVEAFEIGYNLI